MLYIGIKGLKGPNKSNQKRYCEHIKDKMRIELANIKMMHLKTSAHYQQMKKKLLITDLEHQIKLLILVTSICHFEKTYHIASQCT